MTTKDAAHLICPILSAGNWNSLIDLGVLCRGNKCMAWHAEFNQAGQEIDGKCTLMQPLVIVGKPVIPGPDHVEF